METCFSSTIRTLSAVEYIRPLRGGSQPHLLRADDDHFYVVKFQNNPQHRRILANELFATRLAHAIGLPVPESVILDISAELIQSTPGLSQYRGQPTEPCPAGLHFGSRLPTTDPRCPIYDYLPDPGLELIANLRDFWGMLAFDQWTCNCDRRQVIFCREHPCRPLRVYMIDQGFCFNANYWNFPDSPLRGIYDRAIVYAGMSGIGSFSPWLERIEGISIYQLSEAASRIPPEWYEHNTAELTLLVSQLDRRRLRLRSQLSALMAKLGLIMQIAGAAQGKATGEHKMLMPAAIPYPANFPDPTHRPLSGIRL